MLGNPTPGYRLYLQRMAEHMTVNHRVVGSSPTRGARNLGVYYNSKVFLFVFPTQGVLSNNFKIWRTLKMKEKQNETEEIVYMPIYYIMFF